MIFEQIALLWKAVMMKLTKRLKFFVHDGINSVADYNSLRVGVGWMSDVGCRVDVVWMSPGKFHDWITFKRLEILS